ncbi:MAG: ABC transporter permease [Syntrophomonadaceae bacterium]|nr:ABC transporter permease [Syntrophomonadaceae bacterium]
MTSLRTILGIMYAETLQLLRNRTQAVIFLLIPFLIFLIIAGVYWDQIILRIPTVILDQNHSSLSRDMVEAIQANENLEIRCYAENYEQVNQLLKAEEARVAVIIPEDFDRAMSRGEPTRILTIIDGSNMIFCNVATGAMGEVVTDLSVMLRANLLLSHGLLTDQVKKVLQGVQFAFSSRYNPTFNYAYFLVLGLGLYILQQTYLLGMVTAISREREQKTWQQFQFLPAARWQIYVGKLLPYLIIGTLQAALICILGARAFGMPLHGQLWLVLVSTVVFLIAVSGFGMLVSAIFSRVNSIRLAMVMAMPSFILSGFTWPLQAMHPIGRVIGECLPLTWYLQAFQSITMKGAGWDVISSYIIILLLMAVICFSLSLVFVDKRQRPNSVYYRLYALFHPY